MRSNQSFQTPPSLVQSASVSGSCTAPIAEREPEGRPGADLDEVDACNAGAARDRATVLVDARQDRGPIIRAEDQAREEAVLRVAQGVGHGRR